MRQILVVTQVGLAFVLLAGAGLVLASFRQLLRVYPGFDVRGVVTASTSVPESLYPKDADARALNGSCTRSYPHRSGCNRGWGDDDHPVG
ncbi:MAG TPA: hypothetical protein VN841_27065, partial [Bryobacteraceae bacterium]|nr:hypothetical protein [Bryobacteraceae bacterium]